MKRVRVLAILLCTFSVIAPLTGSASSDSECPAYPYCADSSYCQPDEDCVKKPGHGCGICQGLA